MPPGRIYAVSGSAMASPSHPLGRATGTNRARARQRALYSRLVAGRALRGEVGEAPARAVSSSVPPFSYESCAASYASQLATPPSWTQRNVGLGHDCVVSSLAPHHHEVTELNAFWSGSAPTSPVEPSGAHFHVYYSKQSRLVRKTYKLSASADLPVLPATQDTAPSTREIPTPRGFYVPVSGCFRNVTYFDPAVFEIEVPDYGKIVDLRVWAEFVHDVRLSSSADYDRTILPSLTGTQRLHGLQAVQVALRSPNVSFPCAHPWWCDPAFAQLDYRAALNLTGSANQFADRRYYRMPELLRSSYLLWQGHLLDWDAAEVDQGIFNPAAAYWLQYASGSTDSDPSGNDINESDYPFNVFAEYDRDIDMRTVFCDSARVRNPRHLESLYPPIGENDYDLSFSTGSDVGGNQGFNGIFALSSSVPFVYLRSVDPFAVYNSSSVGKGVQGNGVPWMYDPRVKPGNVTGSAFTASLGLSPPPGWLTGPGGTAAENEFPTTGTQLGPKELRPVYPLLDGVYGSISKKHPSWPPSFDAWFSSKNFNKVLGFRPGLRGTEVHGKWQFLVGMCQYLGAFPFNYFNNSFYRNPVFDPDLGYRANPAAGIWFRQLRLEFVLDQGRDLSVPSRLAVYDRHSYVPKREGKRRFHVVSGSTLWDFGTCLVFTENSQEPGRTVGITDKTGSYPDYAVFSRVTGALADRMAVSGAAALTAFLNNPFGTPFIPLSSGSGVPPSFDVFSPRDAASARALVRDVLKKRPLSGLDGKLAAHLSRAGSSKSRAQEALEFIQSMSGTV